MFTPQQIGKNILLKAESHLGEREDPPGSNDGGEVRRYQAYVGIDSSLPVNQKEWCAAAASFWTGMTLLQMDCHATICRTGSSHEAVNFGINHHTIQTPQTAVPGDWCILIGGDGEQALNGLSYHHSTLLVKIEDGVATWLGGNTGDAVAYGTSPINSVTLLRPYVLR